VELYLHSPNTPSWRGSQLGGAQEQLCLFYLLPLPRLLIQNMRRDVMPTTYHHIVAKLRKVKSFAPCPSTSAFHSYLSHVMSNLSQCLLIREKTQPAKDLTRNRQSNCHIFQSSPKTHIPESFGSRDKMKAQAQMQLKK